jgi:excisionase family DNA binding protein
MSEPQQRPTLVVQLTVEELRAIVEEAVRSALKAPREDRLLTITQACAVLNCSKGWLYHNAKTLPFARKEGGHLRFSALGIQRYIEASRLKAV